MGCNTRTRRLTPLESHLHIICAYLMVFALRSGWGLRFQGSVQGHKGHLIEQRLDVVFVDEELCLDDGLNPANLVALFSLFVPHLL